MESKFNNRSIASLAMIVESYPKLEAFRKNQAPESIQKDQDNSLEKFKLKRDALTEKIKKERQYKELFCGV
jgi:tellurite resistance protein